MRSPLLPPTAIAAPGRTGPRHPSARDQRGGVIVMIALSIVVLLGFTGLAIDGGRAYGVKAKLSAAADAAAIAGARAIAEGANDGERAARAQAAAERFFNANYPRGFQNTTVAVPVTTATRDPMGFWQITVNVTARMPTFFMRVLGQDRVDVVTVAQTIRRDVDLMLVMDSSGSLSNPPGTMRKLQDAAIDSFVTRFIPGPGGDRMGMASFASGSVLNQPIDRTATRGFDRDRIVTAINALASAGTTAGGEGMRRGLEELNAVPAAMRSSLRVILFFSDGAPNQVSATFNTASGTVTGNLFSDTSGNGLLPASSVYRNDRIDQFLNSYTIPTLPDRGAGNVPLASYHGRRTLTGSPVTNTRCNVNKAARNMVENVANDARAGGVIVYTIGLGANLNTLEVGMCGYTNEEHGSQIMKRLANTRDSGPTFNPAQPIGLYCHAATASDLEQCFSTIASEILRLTQ